MSLRDQSADWSWQSVPCRSCKYLFSCKALSYFAVGADAHIRPSSGKTGRIFCAFGDGSMCSIDPYATHQKRAIAAAASSRPTGAEHRFQHTAKPVRDRLPRQLSQPRNDTPLVPCIYGKRRQQAAALRGSTVPRRRVNVGIDPYKFRFIALFTVSS